MTDKKTAAPRDHYSGMPNAVRIGNYWFEVEMMELGEAMANEEFGHINLISQKIRFSEGMSPRKLANCFLHEVMHGIHWVFGLGDRSDEESFTMLGANGLCLFWQDNPGVMQWWARINNGLPE